MQSPKKGKKEKRTKVESGENDQEFSKPNERLTKDSGSSLYIK
jgi:hypothetical protein